MQRFGRISSLGAVLVLAALLRTVHLHDQVVHGDEVQAILVSRVYPLPAIATRFFPSDPSLPIAIWARLLRLTVGLEEWNLRLPSVLAGIALVALLARASRDWMPTAERLLFAALLATSPILVHWSRMARPYAGIALLGCLAAVALVRLRAGHERRWFLLAAASQAGMLVSSPTALPSAAGLGLGAWILGRRDGSPRWRALLPSAAGVALAALVLAPALSSLLDVAGGKLAGSRGATPATLADAARIAFGFPAGPAGAGLALGATGLALLGWVGLVARDRALGLAALAVLAVPLLAYGLAPVYLVERGPVFARYQTLAVPWLLGFATLGVGSLREPLVRRAGWLRAPAAAAIAGGVVLHVALGPLPLDLPPANPFGLGRSSLFFPPAARHAVALPRFYSRVPRDAVLVEWPGDNKLEPIQSSYQRLHGRRVVRWYPVRTRAQAPGTTRFRTFCEERVPPSGPTYSGSYLVLHELPEVEGPWFRYGRRPVEAERRADVVKAQLADDARRLHGLCERVCGAPVFEDRWIRAYRLP